MQPKQRKEALDSERRRRRAMIVFQLLCYGYLLTMFGIQMYMRSVRRW